MEIPLPEWSSRNFKSVTMTNHDLDEPSSEKRNDKHRVPIEMPVPLWVDGEAPLIKTIELQALETENKPRSIYRKGATRKHTLLSLPAWAYGVFRASALTSRSSSVQSHHYQASMTRLQGSSGSLRLLESGPPPPSPKPIQSTQQLNPQQPISPTPPRKRPLLKSPAPSSEVQKAVSFPETKSKQSEEKIVQPPEIRQTVNLLLTQPPRCAQTSVHSQLLKHASSPAFAYPEQPSTHFQLHSSESLPSSRSIHPLGFLRAPLYLPIHQLTTALPLSSNTSPCPSLALPSPCSPSRRAIYPPRDSHFTPYSYRTRALHSPGNSHSLETSHELGPTDAFQPTDSLGPVFPLASVPALRFALGSRSTNATISSQPSTFSSLLPTSNKPLASQWSERVYSQVSENPRISQLQAVDCTSQSRSVSGAPPSQLQQQHEQQQQQQQQPAWTQVQPPAQTASMSPSHLKYQGRLLQTSDQAYSYEIQAVGAERSSKLTETVLQRYATDYPLTQYLTEQKTMSCQSQSNQIVPSQFFEALRSCTSPQPQYSYSSIGSEVHSSSTMVQYNPQGHTPVSISSQGQSLPHYPQISSHSLEPQKEGHHSPQSTQTLDNASNSHYPTKIISQFSRFSQPSAAPDIAGRNTQLPMALQLLDVQQSSSLQQGETQHRAQKQGQRALVQDASLTSRLELSGVSYTEGQMDKSASARTENLYPHPKTSLVQTYESKEAFPGAKYCCLWCDFKAFTKGGLARHVKAEHQI